MRSIAFAGSYHCPEPVLLILGGNPPQEFTLESYVLFDEVFHEDAVFNDPKGVYFVAETRLIVLLVL